MSHSHVALGSVAKQTLRIKLGDEVFVQPENFKFDMWWNENDRQQPLWGINPRIH